jgi:hypothetical protein
MTKETLLAEIETLVAMNPPPGSNRAARLANLRASVASLEAKPEKMATVEKTAAKPAKVVVAEVEAAPVVEIPAEKSEPHPVKEHAARHESSHKKHR